ncbi:MAG: histidine kinase N-terminal 7TM domain-containing protein [Lachnospiraceae bacterium]|nr:hypothetical protein [Robinsoniella sp.]MDY3767503.1 histidine kinase N-terminal 7TM domain-containing protein [Lachnospiraceae bacterium]
MIKKLTKTRRHFVLYCTGVFFAALIREAFLSSTSAGLLNALSYIMLILIWGYSVMHRIPSKDIKRWLILADFFMLLWILLRVIKYWYFDDDRILRSLWYAFYIPQTLVPLFVFFASLCAGRKQQIFSKKWYLLFFPAIALITGVMTNDLHQLVFQFQPGFADWNKDYTYGFLYFIDMLWLFGLFISSVCVLFIRSKVPKSRKYVWIPFIWLPLAIAYGVYYPRGPVFLPKRLFEMPEAICFLMISLIECCIQTGLILSNINYHRIFMASSVSAQIVDEDGEMVFASENAVSLSEEQRRQSGEKDIAIDKNTILHSRKIHGGSVYWSDDISLINQLMDSLSEISEELSGENELLKAENKLIQQRAKISEQAQIYDTVTSIVRPQLEKIDLLLSDLSADSPDFRKKMGLACVLNAYIKRRSNLALLAQNAEDLSTDELALCIRESLDYLTQYGVLCSLWETETCVLPCRLTEAFYETFETVVEETLPGLCALLVTLGVEHGIPFLKLAMEGVVTMPVFLSSDLVIQSEEQDGTLFLKITGKGGEDR